MEYTLQKVNWGNIGEAVCVEEETLPNSCYLRDNSDYFLNQTKGELTLVLSGDEPVGIGKLSLLPDGSGWLETLRVRPDWQGRRKGHLQPLAEGSATTGMPGCPDVYWHQKCPQPGTGGTVWPFACGNLHRRYGKNS